MALFAGWETLSRSDNKDDRQECFFQDIRKDGRESRCRCPLTIHGGDRLSEHLEKIMLVARRRAENRVDILLIDNRAGTRTTGLGFELRAQVVHVRFSALHLFGALHTIPARSLSASQETPQPGSELIIPKHITRQKLLRLVHDRLFRLLALLFLLHILDDILLRREERLEHGIRRGRAGEVGDGEGVGEEVADVGVHDAFLRFAVVAEEHGVEVAAVLLRHPVEALAGEEDVGGLGDWEGLAMESGGTWLECVIYGRKWKGVLK